MPPRRRVIGDVKRWCRAGEHAFAAPLRTVKLRPNGRARHPELLASPLASRRPLRDRIGDLSLYGLSAAASIAALVLIALLIYKIFEGAWPSINQFGVPFVWDKVWNENGHPEAYGALSLIYGTAITSRRSAPDRGAGLDRDRALPQRARARRGSRHGRRAHRDAGGDPERDHRPLGDPRARPVRPEHARAVPGQLPRLDCRSSRATHHTGGLLPAMIVLTIMIIPISSAVCRELFLTVPTRPEGGRVRARPDALGDGARRHPPVHARRGRRGDPARPGTRARRGDRGHAGDREPNVTAVSWFKFGNTLASNIANKYPGRGYEPPGPRSSTSPRSCCLSR